MGYDALSFKIGIAMGHISPARSFPKRESAAFLREHAEEGETPTNTTNGVDYVGNENKEE